LEVSTNNLQGLTVGVEKPLVVISTACIESFSRSELLFVLGCEVGRLKSQHVLYENIAWLFPLVTSGMSSIPGLGAITSTFTVTVNLALIQWLRMADYTAARAGLLACQDINSAITALAKIAGLPKKYFDSFNIDDFVTQAREFEGFGDTRGDRVIQLLSLSVRDQAFTVARTNELLKWIDSGNYQAVLERKTKIQLAPSLSFCRHCGVKLEPSHTFCPSCGKKVSS
jgi:Zn-dependent protease with chaperone function